MDELNNASLTTILAFLNGWFLFLFKNVYHRLVERRKFRHFRILVIGRVIQELDNIWEFLHAEQAHEPAVRISDLVVTALVDAGFVSNEIPRVFIQACQDTRGRFAGLIGKLSRESFDTQFLEAVKVFFEPEIRFGEPDGAAYTTSAK